MNYIQCLQRHYIIKSLPGLDVGFYWIKPYKIPQNHMLCVQSLMAIHYVYPALKLRNNPFPENWFGENYFLHHRDGDLPQAFSYFSTYGFTYYMMYGRIHRKNGPAVISHTCKCCMWYYYHGNIREPNTFRLLGAILRHNIKPQSCYYGIIKPSVDYSWLYNNFSQLSSKKS